MIRASEQERLDTAQKQARLNRFITMIASNAVIQGESDKEVMFKVMPELIVNGKIHERLKNINLRSKCLMYLAKFLLRERTNLRNSAFEARARFAEWRDFRKIWKKEKKVEAADKKKKNQLEKKRRRFEESDSDGRSTISVDTFKSSKSQQSPEQMLELLDSGPRIRLDDLGNRTFDFGPLGNRFEKRESQDESESSEKRRQRALNEPILTFNADSYEFQFDEEARRRNQGQYPIQIPESLALQAQEDLNRAWALVSQEQEREQWMRKRERREAGSDGEDNRKSKRRTTRRIERTQLERPGIFIVDKIVAPPSNLNRSAFGLKAVNLPEDIDESESRTNTNSQIDSRSFLNDRNQNNTNQNINPNEDQEMEYERWTTEKKRQQSTFAHFPLMGAGFFNKSTIQNMDFNPSWDEMDRTRYLELTVEQLEAPGYFQGENFDRSVGKNHLTFFLEGMKMYKKKNPNVDRDPEPNDKRLVSFISNCDELHSLMKNKLKKSQDEDQENVNSQNRFLPINDLSVRYNQQSRFGAQEQVNSFISNPDNKYSRMFQSFFEPDFVEEVLDVGSVSIGEESVLNMHYFRTPIEDYEKERKQKREKRVLPQTRREHEQEQYYSDPFFWPQANDLSQQAQKRIEKQEGEFYDIQEYLFSQNFKRDPQNYNFFQKLFKPQKFRPSPQNDKRDSLQDAAQDQLNNQGEQQEQQEEFIRNMRLKQRQEKRLLRQKQRQENSAQLVTFWHQNHPLLLDAEEKEKIIAEVERKKELQRKAEVLPFSRFHEDKNGKSELRQGKVLGQIIRFEMGMNQYMNMNEFNPFERAELFMYMLVERREQIKMEQYYPSMEQGQDQEKRKHLVKNKYQQEGFKKEPEFYEIYVKKYTKPTKPKPNQNPDKKNKPPQDINDQDSSGSQKQKQRKQKQKKEKNEQRMKKQKQDQIARKNFQRQENEENRRKEIRVEKRYIENLQRDEGEQKRRQGKPAQKLIVHPVENKKVATKNPSVQKDMKKKEHKRIENKNQQKRTKMEDIVEELEEDEQHK